MSNISQWSTSAEGNQDTPPDGWPETTMTIPQVNDSARENMAAIARWYGDTKGSLVTAGSSNAYTLTTNSAHAALADQSAFVFRADRSNTGAATLNVDSLGAKDMVIRGGQALESGNIVADQMVMAVYNSDQDRYELSFIGSGTTAADLASSALGFALVNGTLSASVDSNILTIALKTLAGNDPSAGDPVFALFRNATLSDGSFVVRRVEAALSLDIVAGATLGTSNSTPFRFWMTLHDDDGTVRLGASNRRTTTGISPLNEAGKSTTTAMGTGADSAATFYTATAITTAAPIQVVGYVEYTSGLATAGTYNNAPDIVHLRTWATPLPGLAIQTHQATKTDAQSPSTGTTAISGLSVTLTPQSAANMARAEAVVAIGHNTTASGLSIGLTLRRDETPILQGDAASSRARSSTAVQCGDSAGGINNGVVDYLDFPGTASAVTYDLTSQCETITHFINRTGADTNNANFFRAASTLTVTEVMG